MSTKQAKKPVIVLDVGGVLVDFDLNILTKTLSQKFGIIVSSPAPPLLDRLFLTVLTGETSFDEIIPTLNDNFGVSIPSKEWRDLSCSIFTGEMPGMKEILIELKTDFFLVALTNTIEVHWTFLLNTYEIINIIDGYVASYKEGMVKPNPAIYQAVQNRYCNGGVPYFYTDDTPENVEGAREMGWRSEVFKSPFELKYEVQKLLA